MPIGPISYSTSADSPLKAFSDSFGVGANIVSTQQAQQQNALALQNQQNMQADARAMGANPSPQNIASFAAKYPMLSDKIKPTYDMATEQQQQARLNQALPIYSAIQNNSPDVAAKLLNNQADGYEASGDTQGAASARAMAKIAQGDPNHAKAFFGTMLAGIMGPQKFAETFKSVNETSNANDLHPAAVKTANAGATVAEANAGVAPIVAGATANKAVGEGQVAAAQGGAAVPMVQADLTGKQATAAKTASDMKVAQDQLKLDREKAIADTTVKTQELQQKYGTLPDAVAAIRDTSVEKAVAAKAQADRFNNFANKYEAFGANLSSSPAINTAAKIFNQTVGTGSEAINFQNEYARLRAAGIADNLPPQVQRLTDSDLKIFANGIPKDTDTPERAVAFLRSMATMKQLEAINEDAKSQWVAANHMGGLGPSKNDIEIEGMAVPKGMAFPAFIRQYQTIKMKDYFQQLANDTVQNSGILKYATPQPNTVGGSQ